VNTSLVVVLALVAEAPNKKEPPAKEPPAIVGEWVGETAVSGGKPKPAQDGGITFTFTADGKLLVREGNRDKPEEGTYKADPKKSPAEIDLVPQHNGNAPTLQGIYKIDGDTLTFCFALGAERPKEFASPAGSQVMLITCKRAKKE
jgi:uncharacterized protein (TIGR03067 family)